MLQSSYRLLARDTRKIVEELIKRVSGFQIVNECLRRHAGPDKNWSSAKDFWITVNYIPSGSHRIHLSQQLRSTQETSYATAGDLASSSSS